MLSHDGNDLDPLGIHKLQDEIMSEIDRPKPSDPDEESIKESKELAKKITKLISILKKIYSFHKN